MKERVFSEVFARCVDEMELTEETDRLWVEEEVLLGFETGVEFMEVLVPGR